MYLRPTKLSRYNMIACSNAVAGFFFLVVSKCLATTILHVVRALPCTFKALGLESKFFTFCHSEMRKDLLDKVQVHVCECPLHTKLSLIRYDKHLVFFCISIRSYGESDRNCLRLFQAIQDGGLWGAISAQLSPCIYMPKQGFSFARSRLAMALI